MSTKTVRKGFASMLQSAVGSNVTVYDAPQKSIAKAPSIFVTIGKPQPTPDDTAIEYTLVLSFFALVGRLGERAAEAEDEIDDMLSATLVFVSMNAGITQYWQGAEVVSVEEVEPALIDGENYTACQMKVRLTVGYETLA